MELSDLKINNFLIFSEKNFSHVFASGTSYILRRNFPSSKNKKPTLKKLFIFQEMEISYIFSKKAYPIFREMDLFKKASYISVENFPSSKDKKNPFLKKFLIFW